MRVYVVMTNYRDYYSNTPTVHTIHKTKESAIEEMNEIISAWEEDLVLENFDIDKSQTYYNCYSDYEEYTIEIIEKELN